jgi:tRNA (adenine22-N1)-methyltransferase
LRVGAGLEALSSADGLDVAVVAGVGGRTAVRMLDREDLLRLGVRRLILQPQTEWATVRRWLFHHDFAIVDEGLVRERRRDYLILAAEPAATATESWHPDIPLDEQFEAGPRLLTAGDPLAEAYWRRELRRQERILRIAGPGGDARAVALARRALSRRILHRLGDREAPRRALI